MKGIFDDIELLIDETQNFAEAKIEEAKLETIQKTVEIGSLLTTWVVIGLLALIVLVAVSVIGGLLLSRLFDSLLLGFSCITALYILFLIIIYVKRHSLSTKILPNIIYGRYLKTQESHGE